MRRKPAVQRYSAAPDQPKAVYGHLDGHSAPLWSSEEKTALKQLKMVSASTRLNKIFILFNRIYLFKAPPSCGYRWQLGGNMVADWRKQVKIEQNQLFMGKPCTTGYFSL